MSKSSYISVADNKHLDLVASLCCVACRMIGYEDTPAEIHHIRTNMGMSQRNDHHHAIPLCPYHHRTGHNAIHKSKELFENDFATEQELLDLINKMIGVVKECA